MDSQALFSAVMENHVCKGCMMGKKHRHAFNSKMHDPAKRVLYRLHADLSGPMHIDSVGGGKYLLLIVDEYSRMAFGWIIKRKSDAAEHIMEFCRSAKVQQGVPVVEFHSDSGGEFISKELEEFFKLEGVTATTTVAHTPQHNMVAERRNRTVFEQARAMMYHAGVPVSLWADAVLTSIYVGNRVVLVRDTKKTPLELWCGQKPDVSKLRVFGCTAYCHVPDEERKKLEPKARKCVFIGYNELKKGYRVMTVCSQLRVRCSRDVTFHETDFTGAQELRQYGRFASDEEDAEDFDTTLEKLCFRGETELIKIVSTEEAAKVKGKAEDASRSSVVRTSDKVRQESRDSAAGTRRSTRVSVPVMRYGGGDPKLLAQAHTVEQVSSVVELPELPTTYEEAVNGPEGSKWAEAIKKEYDAMDALKVWTVVKRPPGVKPMGNKLVLKRKLTSDGKAIEKYKARSTAKGYTQVKGVNYSETFAPTLNLRTLRVLLAIAAAKDLEIKQIDVQTAFLNADIKEDLYMDLPEGYRMDLPHDGTWVCKLQKALYGTKQAPHNWNEDLNESLIGLKYERSISDPCVYWKHSRSGRTIIIGVFVDDCTVICDKEDLVEWEETKNQLTHRYDISDMGDAEHLLGMRVRRDRANRTLTLDQAAYTERKLRQYGMWDCRSVDTPSAAGVDLTVSEAEVISEKDQKEIEQFDYCGVVGSLMYASVLTRPDISYSVSVLTQYMQKPHKKHVIAAKRVLRYLRGTVDLGLTLGPGSTEGPELGPVFSDSDWAGDKQDRKSRTGFVIKVAGGVVDWGSHKQSVVALSSSEAEYVAAATVTREVIWLRGLLKEIGMEQNVPTELFVDNQTAISIVNSPTKQSDRTKHIDVRHHFVRDAVADNIIKPSWVRTEEQEADIFTKGLGTMLFKKFRMKVMGNGK
jgi:hypothetical protein